LDYFPFGSQRISSGSHTDQRQFIGQVFDPDTSLNYLQARYLQSSTGRFISQDPAFLAFGDTKKTEDITKMRLEDILRDPQSLNSYAYARNNPMVKSDPTGEWEVHISPIIPGINVGLGGEVGNSWSLGFASDGTFGLSTSLHGGGLAGVDASINWSVGYSNANTWSDTLGTGQYVSAGGKIIGGGGITTNYSDGKYTGTDINFGLGLRGLPNVPVAFSGGANKTTPVFQGSVKPVIDAVKTSYNAVRNTVTNGVTAVKQGANNLLNYVSAKLGN
jgi:RHS repeat-associated protein